MNRHDNIFRHFFLFQSAGAARCRAEGAAHVRGRTGELLLGPHLQNCEPNNIEHARFYTQGGMLQRQRNARGRVSLHHDVDLGDVGPARNLRLHVDRQLDAAAENVTHFGMKEETCKCFAPVTGAGGHDERGDFEFPVGRNEAAVERHMDV